MSYRVVEEFEAALGEFTGAPSVVTTCSGSMALQIAMLMWPAQYVRVPKKTYCSVPNAVLAAGHTIMWSDMDWQGSYLLSPLPVIDSARSFKRGMFKPGYLICVSFQSTKPLGLEQGGAILHDREGEVDDWMRRLRFDGRLNAHEKIPRCRGLHAYMSPSVAALGLQRLACLPDNPPDLPHDFADLSTLDFWK